MLTLVQCKNNAYAITKIMNSNVSIDSAVSSINNVCNLDITRLDLIKVIDLRVRFFQFDLMFLVWE